MQAPDISATGYSRTGNEVHAAGTQNRYPKHTLVSALRNVIPEWLSRPFARSIGFILVAVAVLCAIALSTWTISDPSLTFANGSSAENWLGYWGASFADISMQFVGFSSLMFVALPFIWGCLRLTHRRVASLKKRLVFVAFAFLLISAALGCIAIPSGWPLQVGLGGVIGDAVLNIPRAFTGDYPSGIFASILFILFAAPGLWTFGKATNLANGIPSRKTIEDKPSTAEAVSVDRSEPGSEIQFEEEGLDWGGFLAVPLGLLMHFWHSTTSFFRRRRQQASMEPVMSAQHTAYPADAKSAEQRVEPSMMEAELRDNINGGSVIAEPSDWQTETAEQISQSETPVVTSTPVQESERVLVETPGMQFDDPVPHTDADDKTPVVVRDVKRTKPKAPTGTFDLPSLELLSEAQNLVDDPSLSNEALEENAQRLMGVLEDFGVKGQILKVRPGPVVTLYELEPAPGVKSSRVIGLAEDIARSMSAIAARVAVVPGRNAIGVELPNKRRETVYLREQLSSKEFKNTKAKLAMCLGKTIGGEPVIADLAKMPHLLMAGTTGSGKSVGINTMILSLLYRLGPDKCKMIMIDPKMLELSIYDGIPHLLTPVVVDPKKAVVALKWTVREMEDRYKKMSKVGVRNIDGFNARVSEAAAKGEVVSRTVQTGFDRHTGEAIYETEELDLEPMPFIVVIIDEMADLMMVAGKDIEGTVQRLAQMARAAGIHVIMATQRPSVDVITGTIKANFPTRISFQVTSKIDSRTILGEMGAEQLLGMGDMLYMAGGGRITRVHGPFVADQEVEDIVNHLKTQGVPQYLEAITEEDEEEEAAGGGSGAGDMGDSDDPYDQAVAVVLRDRKVSTSYIQRRLSIGYNRAASLIERMEEEGLISAANHAGKREILVPDENETI